MKLWSAWTAKEDARAAALLAEGYSQSQVGAALGRSKDSVKRRLQYLRAEPAAVASFWTVERIEALRDGVMSGRSFSDIAKELGCTKNSALGKATRLCIAPDRPAAPPRAKPVAVQSLRRPRGRTTPITLDTQHEAKPRPTPPLDESPHIAKPWLERRFGQCAYPVSGSGAETFSCCAPVWEGRSYCLSHARVMYQNPRTEAQREADYKRAARMRAGKARAA